MEKIKKFAIVLVQNEKNEYLFGKRIDNNLWTTVAGGIEENEAPTIGAIRELREEANINVSPNQMKFINEFTRTIKDTREDIKLFLYKVKIDTTKVNISSKQDPDREIYLFKWFSKKIPTHVLENLHVPRGENIAVQYIKRDVEMDNVTFKKIGDSLNTLFDLDKSRAKKSNISEKIQQFRGKINE